MPRPPSGVVPRHRVDRCPGVLRPWVADDGALLRVRLVGGRLDVAQLTGLAALARRYGDGRLHLTSRANVQLRALPVPVPAEVARQVRALGLLPSASHDLVRNVLVSPLTGRAGGRADVRPLADELDAGLRADPVLARLPGKFLFALDDRGDLVDHPADLAALALDRDTARLHAAGADGHRWPLEDVRLADVPARLLELARRFVRLRGDGPASAWHVAELAGGPAALGAGTAPARPFVGSPPPRPPHGPIQQDDGRWALHVPVPDGVAGPEAVARLVAVAAGPVVVTPWRSVLLPDLEGRP